MLTYPVPQLQYLPSTLPLDGAIRIELQRGLPIFRASVSVQKRIETLLHKQREARLSLAEIEELDLYEEIDDYLSFINRVVRNLMKPQPIAPKHLHQ
jgi:hypothetical protein